MCQPCAPRVGKIMLLMAVGWAILLVRLFFLQIIAGPELATRSIHNRIQEVPLKAARGEIFDRNGYPLTNTDKRLSVIAFPGLISDRDYAAARMAAITGEDNREIRRCLTAGGRPFRLPLNIDLPTARELAGEQITGVIVAPETVRYSNQGLAAHVIGYTNAADNEGVSGIELMFDEVLKGGQEEYAAALVDARDKLIPGLGYKHLTITGGHGPNNVWLTIDRNVQAAVEKIIDKYKIRGAVIVSRPYSGEILALASRPKFDANNLAAYLAGDSAALLNRAVSAFQPGSVFKPAVAAAALEAKKVTPDELFFDPGYIDVDGVRFKGWDYEQGGHGRISFTDALAYSSNPVFIEVAARLGPDKLLAMARDLGFGKRTRLEFPGEQAGILPPADSMVSAELANFAIGQGAFEATPLQILGLVSTIVNEGVKVEPVLIAKLTNSRGEVIKNYQPYRGDRVFSVRTARQLQAMMRAVTEYGTGKEAALAGFGGAAGKTGTAETGRRNRAGEMISHAWFAGYTPAVKPQYSIVVFIEEGMSGAEAAAPIFREIAQTLLANN